MGDKKCIQIYFDNLKGRDHFGAVGVYVRMILKLILEECGVMLWTRFNGPRIGSSVEVCEHSNETSGSIKFGEFL
jgi:hypothetical protein